MADTPPSEQPGPPDHEELEEFDDAWSHGELMRKLWDLRRRDAIVMVEFATRLERLEAAFESGWSVLRRLEGQTAELTEYVETLDSVLTSMVTNQGSVTDAAVDSTALDQLAHRRDQVSGGGTTTNHQRPSSFDDDDDFGREP